MAIQRSALRSQVREEILHRMRSGAVKPGQRINEVQFASELGISRTPLREALIALEGEGQITSESGKGFSFLPLSRTELLDLAPVIATLEGLALDLSSPDDLRTVGRQLQALAEQFADESARLALLNQRDDEWHQLMCSVCPNQRLLTVIEGVRATFHRYEALLFTDDQVVVRRAEEHLGIARHLVDGDVPAAKAALLQNWTDGTSRLLSSSAAG